MTSGSGQDHVQRQQVELPGSQYVDLRGRRHDPPGRLT